MNEPDFNNDQPGKIIQVIAVPAPTYAVYKNDDGKEYRCRILFAGLRADGELMFLDCDSSGYFEGASDVGNFVRFDFPGE